MMYVMLVTETEEPLEAYARLPKRPAGWAYMVTNSVNGKRYIGITTRDPKRRWADHVRRHNRWTNRPLHEAIVAHGVDRFVFEVLACAETLEALGNLERVLIAQHETFFVGGRGYNLTLGGPGALGSLPTKPPRVVPPGSARWHVLSNFFGCRVASERVARRMTQGDLGMAAGMVQQRIALIETGQVNLSLRSMCRIAGVFGIYIADMLES